MKTPTLRLLCLGLALFFIFAARKASAAVPTITMQPVGGAFPCGSNFTLSVAATGLPPLTYQWWRDPLPLVDATNSSVTLSASASTAGDYTVFVSNPDGSITSTVAAVTCPDGLWKVGLRGTCCAPMSGTPLLAQLSGYRGTSNAAPMRPKASFMLYCHQPPDIRSAVQYLLTWESDSTAADP